MTKFKLDHTDFSKQVNVFIDQFELDVNQAIRWIALDLFDKIISQTPVDEGTLRASWVLGVNRIPGNPGKGSGDSEASAQGKLSTAQAGDFIWIVNHMPYAKVIEYGEFPGQGPKTTASGYSTQAPRGVVRISVKRAADRFNRSMKKIGKKKK